MFFFMFLIFFLSLGFKSRPELAIFSTFQPLSDLCQCLFHEIWNTHTKGWVEESWGSCSNQQIYILYIVQFWTFAFFSKFSREILKLSFYMIFYISIGSEIHIRSGPNFFLNYNHGYELCECCDMIELPGRKVIFFTIILYIFILNYPGKTTILSNGTIISSLILPFLSVST